MEIKTNNGKTPSLMTITITLDGYSFVDGIGFYINSDASMQSWDRYGLFDLSSITSYYSKPSSNSSKPSARSETWKASTLYELWTESYGQAYDIFAQDQSSQLVMRPRVSATITSKEDFINYLHEHPITIELLLTSSGWGGLH